MGLRRQHFVFPLFCIVAATMLLACTSGEGKPRHGKSSFEVSGPIVPFESHGDLWFSTWASDDSLFVSWGDGLGPYNDGIKDFSHHGLTRLRGTLPHVEAEVVQKFMPLSDDEHNSKPTSLLFLDGRLYVAIHAPLIFPEFGFIAYSDDYGATFQYDTDTPRSKQGNDRFICLMFINMGKNYELNTDGYVYAFGVQAEVNISGLVYLARMPRDSILDYSTWTFFAGIIEDNNPQWSDNWRNSTPIDGLTSYETLGFSEYPIFDTLFSAIYHPGIKRYIALKASVGHGELFEAPHPWGKWTLVGKWFEGVSSPWYPAYMPGIITKDLEPDSFYFSVSGQITGDPPIGDDAYRFRLGKITMYLD